MLNRLFACLRDQRGATAIEYSLIVSFIAIVIVTAAALVGADLAAIFTGLTTVF